MFENKCSTQGIKYSRYIASWINIGGRYFELEGRFGKWLRAEGLTEEEIVDICMMAKCGKCELEAHAKEFVA